MKVLFVCKKATSKKHVTERSLKEAVRKLSIKSGQSSEPKTNDLVVDSGNTDHVIVNKNWFRNLKKVDTTVTIPDGVTQKSKE